MGDRPKALAYKLAALTSFVILGWSAPVSAQPATLNTTEIGLGFRLGVSLEEGDLDPWGTGLGLRVGHTLPNAFYVGGAFDYFFGETLEAAGAEVSGNIWELMAEGGYDVELASALVLRPRLGLGFASLSREICALGACEDNSEIEFNASPALALMYLGGPNLSFDTRLDMIFAEEQINALVFSLGIGF